MDDRTANPTILERIFFSHPRWIPSVPLYPARIDEFLERFTYRLIFGATVLAIAAFYGPEALAYKSHIDDTGIKTATKVNWSLLVVAVYVAGTTGTYCFATFRAKRDRLLTECLKKNFPNSKAPIQEVLEHHHGLLRLSILSALVSGSIIGGAAFMQESNLWWRAPQLHVPLAFFHLSGVFFVAGYFLLRGLAVNRAMKLTFEYEWPPSIPFQKNDESDMYSQLGYHYLMMSSFALFSAVYLFSVWLGLQLESGGITPSFGFASAITWTAAPVYFMLVYGLVFRPMLTQRRPLQEWNKKRLNSLAEKIDLIVGTKSGYNPSDLERLATYKVAYDALKSSFPEWPLHPNQGRIIVVTTTGLLFPFVGVVMRSLA